MASATPPTTSTATAALASGESELKASPSGSRIHRLVIPAPNARTPRVANTASAVNSGRPGVRGRSLMVPAQSPNS